MASALSHIVYRTGWLVARVDRFLNIKYITYRVLPQNVQYMPPL